MGSHTSTEDQPKFVMPPVPQISCVASWYGSCRMGAHHVGDALKGCEHVTIAAGGSMSEIPYIDARTLVVNDIHRHVINLCMVIASPTRKDELIRILLDVPFHPDILKSCQATCRVIENDRKNAPWDFSSCPDIGWAAAYFICVWMARSALAGTKREFDTTLATRFTATGGDSVVRFRNATASIDAWSEVMRRCNFEAIDMFKLFDKVKDRERHGLYIDPPFPETGDNYKFNCGDTPGLIFDWHANLRDRLIRFEKCRVVCRFFDTPLIQALYGQGNWEWLRHTGRTQANKIAPEVLLVRNGN